MKSEQECIEYLIELAGDIEHGEYYYTSHCLGVYTFLKQMQSPVEVCLAGLYHSIYGTQYFDPNLEVSRSTITDLIGERAEDLVYTLCSIDDRDVTVLKNINNYSERKYKDLSYICYANLLDQAQTLVNDQSLKALIKEYEVLISNNFSNSTVDLGTDEKIFKIFDNILTNSEIDWLHSFCLNANYKCEHSSSPFGYERDSRFASNISKKQLQDTGILNTISKLSSELGVKLYIGKSYINHYQLMTSTERHTDSSFGNNFTILIFCNKYWEETWGGELKIYEENSNIHKIVDYVPGRILFFDSRIEHKVMPLTHAAKKDRFTIAVKCSNIEGLNNLISMYGNDSILEIP